MRLHQSGLHQSGWHQSRWGQRILAGVMMIHVLIPALAFDLLIACAGSRETLRCGIGGFVCFWLDRFAIGFVAAFVAVFVLAFVLACIVSKCRSWACHVMMSLLGWLKADRPHTDGNRTGSAVYG